MVVEEVCRYVYSKVAGIGMSDKRTMTLNLSEAEMRALEELCTKKDLSKTAVLRQALRLYQTVDSRVDQGHKLMLESSNEKSELMLL
jgi:hypothetical protein